jgi:hypothetical protein
MKVRIVRFQFVRNQCADDNNFQKDAESDSAEAVSSASLDIDALFPSANAQELVIEKPKALRRKRENFDNMEAYPWVEKAREAQCGTGNWVFKRSEIPDIDKELPKFQQRAHRMGKPNVLIVSCLTDGLGIAVNTVYKSISCPDALLENESRRVQ